MWKCKHCKNEFDFDRNCDRANHSRHCSSNPKKQESYVNIGKAIKGKFEERAGKEKEFEVSCKTCFIDFIVVEHENLHPMKEQYFCSRSCANSVGGKAKAAIHHTDDVATYRTVAWRHHEKKCIVCGEDKVVAVHHFNENHYDNRPENLVPLCPTHHQYMHSKHKHLILDTVVEYIGAMMKASTPPCTR